jgi:hypothetical protein
MTSLLRRLRGALGLALTWSVVWTVLGGLLAGATYLLFPQDFDPGETVPVIIGLFALLGFLAGLGFAAVLTFAERRHQLTQLTVWRGALWGAIGAVGSQLLLGGALSMVLILAPLGALLGAASFAVARKALPTANEAALIDAPPPAR